MENKKIPLDLIKLTITYLEPEQFINFFDKNNLNYALKFKYVMKNNYEFDNEKYIATKQILDLFPNIITEYNKGDWNTFISAYNILILHDGSAGLAYSN